MSDFQYVSPSQRRLFDVKKYSKEQTAISALRGRDEFYELCAKAKQHVLNVYDKKVESASRNETEENYVEIYHNAMRGQLEAVNLIKKHIEDFTVNNGVRDVEYPSYYPSLTDGIFEEEFGWGPLSVFRFEEKIEGAQVLGTDIKFKRSWGWELQPFSFKNVERVYDLAQRFSNMHAKTTLDSILKPELETRTLDNIRVSIMIPERMHSEPVITLRRKTIADYSFEHLAKFGTFPKEVVPLLESLAKFQVNSIIAGPPGTGKSTLLQAFMNAMLYEYRDGKQIPERINTVYAEANPEFEPREQFPRTNVLHLVGRGQDFENTISSSILRHDISRVILGEIREHEVGLYRRAGLQGLKQVIGTLHDLDPVDIPEIMTNLYMQYLNNGLNPDAVYRTFARNLHYSISMDEYLIAGNDEIESLQKRISSIQIYDYDMQHDQLHLYTIMEYRADMDIWHFSAKLPERFRRMMMKYHKKDFERFIGTLNQLEKDWPMGNVGNRP